jgi:hypothetical protein
MITELISLGKYLYLATDYAYENRKAISYICGIYDATKFTYEISTKFGILDYVWRPTQTLEKIKFIEHIGIERTSLGDFDILD